MRMWILGGLIVCLSCAWIMTQGCGVSTPDAATPAPAATAAAGPAEKVFGGFEDEIPKEWYGSEAKLSSSEDHATEGKKSMQADLEPGQYPGIGVDLKGQDWSGYRALRFSVFNKNGGTQWVSIRIDDTASKGYSTRYNLEDHAVAVKFNPGQNEIEIPIASLRQGTPESQGIDVGRIKLIRMFIGGLKRPITLFFDNFRLAPAEPKGPDALTLADFDTVPGKVEPGTGTQIRVEASPDGKNGQALRIELTPEGDYPGVYVSPPQDWLSYDLLCFNIFCPEDKSTPGAMSFKISDGAGRQQTFSTGLVKGMNEICLPMEAASFVSLSRVKELNLFWGRPAGNLVVYLDNVRLERAKLTDHPSRHDAAAEGDPFAIDFTGLQTGKNTCYMVTAWIPLEAGGYRVVRCNAPSKQQVSYSIDAEAFKGYAAGKPIRVWTVFLDHGVWNCCETFIPLKATGPTKLMFDDAARFGR